MSLIGIASALIEFVPVIAPTVAKWFAGDKAEQAAQDVVDIAMAVTGKVDPLQAMETLDADPTLQAQFRAEMLKAEAELTKLYIEDVQHARQVQITVGQNGRSRLAREFIYWYAAGLTLVSFGYIIAITFVDIPESGVRFADTILGFVLGTVVSAIIQFFFGNSRPVGDD